MSFKKASAIFTGVLVIFWGGMTIHHPKWYSFVYHREFDLTGFNIPIGIALIISGVVIIWIDVIRPRKDNLICPKCEELYRWKKSLGDKCPKCGTILEDLEGFYERHPELRYKRKIK